MAVNGQDNGLDSSQVRKALGVAIYWMEVLSGGLLVLLAGLALVNFIVLGAEALQADLHLDSDAILELIDAILIFFIGIELFKIALAYMRKSGDVVHTVLEAALVAIARKLVVFVETDVGVLEKAISLALLVLAVGVTWFLLERAGIRGGSAPHEAEGI
jgi:uncharacterized membrane protein (DUF373 family)